MNDRVAEAFNERARSRDSGLSTLTRRLKEHPTFERWPGGFLARPLFLGRAETLAFAADLQRLVALLTALPDRLFDGDLDRFCAAVRVTGERATLMRRLGEPSAPHCGRADVYHDGTSMKLLEFGIGSELGGWGRGGEICRSLLADEEFGAFAGDHRLSYIHNGRYLAGLLRQLGATVAPDREPAVAIIEGPGALVTGGHGWRVLEDVLRWLGIDIHLGEVTEIEERGDRLHLRGVPIDVVYRAFEADQLVGDADAMARAELIFRAHEAGAAVLWTPLESNIYCEKTCMALLSAPGARDRFTAAERALVDRVLPWTRELVADSFRDDPDLVDECVARRRDLIVKPNGRYGGIGVVAGWEVAERDWPRLLREKAADGCIVQERVVPRDEEVIDPTTGKGEPWHAVYGFFYTPLGHSGAYARTLPAPESAVIGTGGKVCTAGVYYYDDGGERAP
ncbi:hypothetical protein SMC26_07440 [Actinomadura fulvescens]|uniref:Circularly permuted type 2 ATP-grasp protein n=1 Tax=Actinomadura fulvescens TaxID=46160 RepID=A0ABP6C6J4_9ACTN